MMFFPDIMMIISISRGHITSKKNRVHKDKGKQKRFLYYWNFGGLFKKRTISFIQSVYLSFFLTHSKIIQCEKCGIKRKVRYMKLKDIKNYKCNKCA